MGTLGLARGTVRADLVIALSVSLGVSFSELSGVLGREVVVENGGRNRDVSEGEGGNGVGGRL